MKKFFEDRLRMIDEGMSCKHQSESHETRPLGDAIALCLVIIVGVVSLMVC